MSSAPADRRPELLTFAPMVNCELARLVLRTYGKPYHEAPHLFGWASVLTLFHGGYGKLPLLHGDGAAMSGPHDMALRYDPALPEEQKLIPAEAPLHSAVEADWSHYMGDVGSAVAIVCYYHMLPERAVMTELFAQGLPPGEARALPTVYPALRWLLTALLGLKPEKVAAALATIRAAFDETDKRIADGRRFLVGDRLTLADLSLAAATAPLLLPEGYDAPVPHFAQMPPALQAIALELRARPTAAFVGRIYEALPQ